MRTALYRQFTDDKTLLYVGISLNAQNRLSQHYKSSAWFTEVTDVTIEWFDTREEALKAEVTAIHDEKPKCNIHHNSQAYREIEEASQEEFQGMNKQVMRLLEGSGKVFFSKSEVGNFLGISNFYITNFIEQRKLKALQPFLPYSRREVFYINDIINLIAEMTEDKL